MKEGAFFADLGNRAALISSVIFESVGVGILLFFWGDLPPEMPWLFSEPWGEPWLVSKEIVLIAVLSFLLIISVNAILGKTLYKKELLLTRFLMWGASAVTFLLMIDVIKIVEMVI